MLTVSAADLAAILTEAAAAYPEECCGLLVGERPAPGDAGDARVLAVLPARNLDPEPRRGYDIDPHALLAGHRGARERGREVVGYYHSHPDGAAVPSRRDRAAALPLASYLIVPVPGGEPGPARSYRLGDGGEMVEEAVEVVAEVVAS